MQTTTEADAAQVEAWMKAAGLDYYICDQCHGLHLSELQGRDGILDARLFVEEDGLLFSVELEVRPAWLFHVQADLSRLNMAYPSLKLFLDVNDDSLPRLVVCDLLLGAAGIAQAQFDHFLRVSLDATATLLEECQHAGWLGWPDEGPVEPPVSLH